MNRKFQLPVNCPATARLAKKGLLARKTAHHDIRRIDPLHRQMGIDESPLEGGKALWQPS
jgi:hypothetical protein